MDPAIEEKIDTVYRNTKEMPIWAIVGFFIPVVLLVGGPLGLYYWWVRRGLLKQMDSHPICCDPVPSSPATEMVPDGLSTEVKLAIIRDEKHSLLMPLSVFAVYAVVVVLIVTAALIARLIKSGLD